MAKSASFGLQIGDQEPSAFEKEENIRDKFQDAHRDYVPLELEDEEGSQMVKDDGQFHDMRPDPSIAADQDRQTFDDKWQAEYDRADAQMLERYVKEQEAENDNSRDQDHDRNRDVDWSL